MPEDELMSVLKRFSDLFPGSSSGLEIPTGTVRIPNSERSATFWTRKNVQTPP